jgi:hypothetical protein
MCMKGIELNKDKTCYTLSGNKRVVEEARRQIKRSPLMCGNFVIKEESTLKYLGDWFDGRGLRASMVTTLRESLGRARGECLNIALIVEEWRGQVTGSFLMALKVYTACVMPSLLYNCSTWTEMPKEAEDIIVTFQN